MDRFEMSISDLERIHGQGYRPWGNSAEEEWLADFTPGLDEVSRFGRLVPEVLEQTDLDEAA